MPHTPSAYQAAIYEAVSAGRGDILVNAVAGSGKTTTLVEAARLLAAPALFIAFNKHIAEELQTRLAGTTMTARTIHSIGYGCVADAIRPRRIKLDDRKYGRLVAQWMEEQPPNAAPGETPADIEKRRREQMAALRELVDKARVTLADAEDMAAVAATIAHYGIDADPDTAAGLYPVLRRGAILARERGEIDYTDMLWLPAVWSLQPARLPWLFVDECQDLSAAARALVLKCRAPGGRMLFVGDERQAIMGFAGADSESFWAIQRETGAQLMPLSISYRCPTSHLALARAIVPHIEARPDAPAGDIEEMSEEEAVRDAQEGDLILCRLTAPLIGLCIRMITKRIPARVRGREIGRALVSMCRDAADRDGFLWDHFPYHLDAHRAEQEAKMRKRRAREEAIQGLNDRAAGVMACWQGFDSPSLDDLCRQIESLFADERASVWLSTIHRAKGLEAERVSILRPDKLRLCWPGQQPWEAVQEQNLEYVALTRSKRRLTFIGHEAAAIPPTAAALVAV